MSKRAARSCSHRNPPPALRPRLRLPGKEERAEALRLLTAGGLKDAAVVSSIEVVVNEAASAAFDEAKHTLDARPDKHDVQHLFHGTSTVCVPDIVTEGLKIVTERALKTDAGSLGEAIYLTGYLKTAMMYAAAAEKKRSGSSAPAGFKVLVSQVLVGKPFHILSHRHGGALEPTYDSHMSDAAGAIVAVFAPKMVCTRFVVTFDPTVLDRIGDAIEEQSTVISAPSGLSSAPAPAGARQNAAPSRIAGVAGWMDGW